MIPEGDVLSDVSGSQFEHCRLIDGYDGIWSQELKLIECGLNQGSIRTPFPFALRQLASLFGESEESDQEATSQVARFEIPGPESGPQISIGPGSTEHAVLVEVQSNRPPFLVRRRGLRHRPTIRFDGVRVRNHNEARNLLERLANAVLFQIDLSTDLAINLAQDGNDRTTHRRRPVPGELQTPSAPTYEYDREPMALYWYARTAFGIPLLQFLGYYQALEFFFPQYSQQEAQHAIRNIMKDPRFDISRDAEVARILSVVKTSGRGRGFGDERSQLQATLTTCLNEQELRNFLEEDTERAKFFVSSKAKRLAKQKVALNNPKADLRIDVANRIYEIRCRVVHTKAPGTEEQLILPFSKEARGMQYDLELIEYVVRQVLISSSRPLRF